MWTATFLVIRAAELPPLTISKRARIEELKRGIRIFMVDTASCPTGDFVEGTVAAWFREQVAVVARLDRTPTQRTNRTFSAALVVLCFLCVWEAAAGGITITVATNQVRPISPWIYGINAYQSVAGAPRNLTLNRSGGNRWTAYNWENNASNAGSDWGPFNNDDYLSRSSTPGEAVSSIIAADRARSSASLITVQLQGYVAADKDGKVDASDPSRFATRFKEVVYRKDGPFTQSPSTSDAYVYMDEYLWALRGRFSGNIYADPAIPTFVSLDNEPDLWDTTHKAIQPKPISPDELIQKSIRLCRALKALDPSIQLFGPGHFGFIGLINWRNSPGYSSTYWFTDHYLSAMKAASEGSSGRLLDVYTFHWYSEATVEGTRVISLTSSNLTDAQIQAIVQSPRSLWDPTYRENSWIADYLGGPIHILDRAQSRIANHWPGTRLAITEYANGGDNHIAGAIAQADNLGIFGSCGLFAAACYPTSHNSPYILAGYKMFRDFDGNLGSFGDLSLPALSSDAASVSAYLSQESLRPDRYVAVVINRSKDSQEVCFKGLDFPGSARVYRLSRTQTSPVFVEQLPVNLSTWSISLPSLSISTIEIRRQSPKNPP